MKHTPKDTYRMTSQDSYRVTRFTEKRSVADTLLETLGQTGLRPAFAEATKSRRARVGQAMAGFLMLFALAALGFALMRPDNSPSRVDKVATLELAHGSVWRNPAWRDPASSAEALPVSGGTEPSRLLSLGAGEVIRAGAVIETGAASAGAPSRAAIRLDGGESMRLDSDTRVRFASSSSVVLERGAVYFDSIGDSSGDSAGSGLEVRTTFGVVRDIGTQFEVRLVEDAEAEDSLRVRVREGSIDLESNGESHRATVGEELQLDSRGALTRGPSPIHGSHWDWVVETAPAPDVTGQPLQVFLDWLAREGGWAVRFADPATAEVASSTILHGDVRSLTPLQASSMVLRGSGLDYRLEEGVLVIERVEVEPAR